MTDSRATDPTRADEPLPAADAAGIESAGLPESEAAGPAEAPTSKRAVRAAESVVRLNGSVVGLICVIAASAFAFSADSWIKLAETAGFTTSFALPLTAQRLYLSWVLPFAVDAYTALTTWLFLTARPGSDLRKYAGRSAALAAGLSVIAQGAYHGLAAADINVAKVWPLVVAVGGIPPVLLGSAIHLLATYLHEHRPAAQQPAAKPARSKAAAPAPRKPAPTSNSAANGKAAPPRPAVPPPPTDAASQRLAVVHDAPESGEPAESKQISDDDLRDVIRPYVLESHRLGRVPAQRAMQRLVREATGASVGQRRCERIANTIPAEGDSADDAEERSA